MIKSIEETPSKCNHIMITLDTGEVITTTKDVLINSVSPDKTLEEQVIETAKLEIEKAGLTDWVLISEMYKQKVMIK